ncbi:MAG: hypothetical protein IT183_01035 [Acidobacteria bacterium]|nr:hypothetical protein [Acidobacteriota bacterium]
MLALVAIGQWPRQAETELVAHVAGCASCTETVTVAAALRELEYEEEAAPLPDARAVWQRAQWQARQDAMQRAARPVVAMEGIAALGIIALIVVAVGWLSTSWLFGDRVAAFWQGLRIAATSVGAAAMSLADLFAFDIPGNVVWLLAGAIALGLTAIAIAIGLSTLADLQSDPRRR